MAEDLLNLDLGELDITTEEINFDEVDDDLDKFQQDDIIKEALSKGVDLRNYSQQISLQLRGAETMCIADYLTEADQLAALHQQIKGVDSTLKRMESMLGGFQNDLGTISSEIKHLQDQSMSMNIKLKNRVAAEERLSAFIRSIQVSPKLVKGICESEVNEEYALWLSLLCQRVHFLKDAKVRQTQAAQDIGPQVNKLRLKAISRVRTELLTRFHALRKPNTNIQIKQKLLLRSAVFYDFLHKASVGQDPGADVAAEIRTTYTDTMARIYQTTFKNYLASMKKLLESNGMRKSDLMGTEESKAGLLFGRSRSQAQLTRLFKLNQRGSVLTDGQDSIIAHVASHGGARFPYERIFASAMKLLVDTATSEHNFVREFFDYTTRTDVVGEEDNTQAFTEQEKEHTRAVAKDMFSKIFAKTLALFLESLDQFLLSAYDALQLLVMIRVLWIHNQTMQTHRIHCLDTFFDQMNMVLWPKFKMIFDANLDSIKRLTPSAPNGNNPHFLSARYAHFTRGVLELNVGYGDDILRLNLGRLRRQVDDYLLQTAARLKRRTIFLINNYNVIARILRAKGIESSEDLLYFEERVQGKAKEYVEEELREKFGKLVRFVKTRSDGDDAVSAAKVEEIVKGFARSWRDGIESINASVMNHFNIPEDSEVPAMPDVATDMLKQVLIQLVLYYQRFQDIIKKAFSSRSAVGKELIPIPTIMFEIKKYGKTGD